MNQVWLIGRVTRELDIRRTQEGKPIVSFSLAVDRKKKDAGADFPNCVAFGKVAELMEQYVSKGNQIAVIGRLQTRTFESKGQKYFTTEVVIDEVRFLEKKKDSPKEAPRDFEFVPGNETLPF